MPGRCGTWAALGAAAGALGYALPAAAVPIQYYFKIAPREARIDAGGKESDVYRVAPGDALTLVAKGPGVLRIYYYQDYMPGKPFPTGIRVLVSVQGKGGKAYDVSPKPLRGMRYTTRGVAETPTAPDPINVVIPAEDVSITIRLAASATFGGAIAFPSSERIPPPEGELELPALSLGPGAEPEMELPALEPMPSLTPPAKVAKAEPPPAIAPLDLPLEEELPALTPAPPAKTAKAEPPKPALAPLDLPLEEELPALTPAPPAKTAKKEPAGIEPLDLPPLVSEEPGLAELPPLTPAPPKPEPGKKPPPGKKETKVAAAPAPRTRAIEATRVTEKPKPLAVAAAPAPPLPPPAPFEEPPLPGYRVTPKIAVMLPRGPAIAQPAYTVEASTLVMEKVRVGIETGYNLFSSSTRRTVTGKGIGQVLQTSHAVPLFAFAAYELPGGGGARPYAALGLGALVTVAQLRAFSLPERVEATLAPAVQASLGVRLYFASGGVLLEVRHQEALAGFSKQALGAEGLLSATMFAAGYAVEF